MTLGSSERFADLSPEEIHRTRQRIAAAFGDAFAAALAGDEFGGDDTVEIVETPGTADTEMLVPHCAEMIPPRPASTALRHGGGTV